MKNHKKPFSMDQKTRRYALLPCNSCGRKRLGFLKRETIFTIKENVLYWCVNQTELNILHTKKRVDKIKTSFFLLLLVLPYEKLNCYTYVSLFSNFLRTVVTVGARFKYLKYYNVSNIPPTILDMPKSKHLIFIIYTVVIL